MNLPVLNLIAATAFAVLYGFACLRYRDLGKRIGNGQTEATGVRLKCLLWTWCFGLAAVGFVFVTVMAFPLKTADYVIAALGGMVGLLSVWRYK